MFLDDDIRMHATEHIVGPVLKWNARLTALYTPVQGTPINARKIIQRGSPKENTSATR